MEHRNDLEQILLAGLPDLERQHVVQAMNDARAEELRWTHARGVAGGPRRVQSDTDRDLEDD